MREFICGQETLLSCVGEYATRASEVVPVLVDEYVASGVGGTGMKTACYLREMLA